MKYEIVDEFGGVPEGFRYEIKDTPEAEKEWRTLLSSFATEFREFTSDGLKDFEFADWHYERRSVFACLYNEKFYNERFLQRVRQILENQRRECFAKFECFDSSKQLLGRFMVFKDKVIFNRLSEQTGLLRKLVDAGRTTIGNDGSH